ncbi:(deoxy)nucleoside triphosphate pyrophosphohydrolase [Planococcus soli]|uniref:(deoxy)nucleoside triphosphate pyrophosphohydrolase n=1 Tax=Planococcus soli TaxID=2666072 RepID=UPI00115D9705|nr:(deoxy)nucleoside triphosphate pyrophosphohydrolase [Planococcus soli]
MESKKIINIVGAVITKGEEILCAQRGNEKALTGLWEFPRGKFDQEELSQEALQREIQEEMHCTVKIGKQVEHTVCEYDFGVVHLTAFYCTLVVGIPLLTEHIPMKWLQPNELSQLEWAPADISAIEKLTSTYQSTK